jgi:hypothetical protein
MHKVNKVKDMPRQGSPAARAAPIKQPLYNHRNGCYIDVIMIALFRYPTPLVQKVMLTPPEPRCIPPRRCSPDTTKSATATRKIQTAVRNVGKAISQNKTTNLRRMRKVIRDCPSLNTKERFDLDGMNDSSVFLDFLVNIFPCLCAVTEKKQTIKCPDCSAKISYVPTHSPLFYLSYGRNIKQWNGKKLSQLVKSKLNKDFNSLKFTKAPLIIFDFTRLDDDMKYRDDVTLYPDETMSFVRGGTKKKIRAIVVWKREHYAVFARVSNRGWYYFDGNHRQPIFIGPWSRLMDYNYDNDTEVISPLRNSKLFVY